MVNLNRVNLNQYPWTWCCWRHHRLLSWAWCSYIYGWTWCRIPNE